MKLGIDLDGVVAKYQTDFDVFGRAIPGLEWWKPEIFGKAEVIEGARTGLLALRNLGHTIKIITARPVHPVTFEWLASNDLCYDTVDHTKAKWNIPCHVYFDDGNQFLHGYHERGLVSVKYRYPHNIDSPATHEVDDWYGFLELIRRPIRGKLRVRPHKLGARP